MNYGHNHPALKSALLAYLESNGITHSLDMATAAKGAFLEALRDLVLAPRDLSTGCSSPVRPAPTPSRWRSSWHARRPAATPSSPSPTPLAVSGNRFKRNGAGLPLQGAVSVPFAGFLPEGGETLDYLERFLDDGGSGMPALAGVICETVQGEGGLATASAAWLQRLAAICRRRGMPLIIDDVQAGCGRTGRFFSFEFAGIQPDIVCLSKSLSGYGLPLAVTLIRPDLDRAWEPGEHNGTFRGHNPAFVTARTAIDTFWRDGGLGDETARRGRRLGGWLRDAVPGRDRRGAWSRPDPRVALHAARPGPAGLRQRLRGRPVGGNVRAGIRGGKAAAPADRPGRGAARRTRHLGRSRCSVRRDALSNGWPMARGTPEGLRSRDLERGGGHACAGTSPGIHGGQRTRRAGRDLVQPPPAAAGASPSTADRGLRRRADWRYPAAGAVASSGSRARDPANTCQNTCGARPASAGGASPTAPSGVPGCTAWPTRTWTLANPETFVE